MTTHADGTSEPSAARQELPHRRAVKVVLAKYVEERQERNIKCGGIYRM